MRRLILYVLALLTLLTGCGAPADPDTARESIQVLAMDTVMLITTYGEHSVNAAYAAEEVIRDLEAKLSRTDPDSEVSRLNASAGEPVEVGEDLGLLLELAGSYRWYTDGAFNINIAPVVSAWGFTEDNFRVPSRNELDGLLELAQGGPQWVRPYSHSSFDHYSLEPGQAIDLGAIVKGYAADKLVEVFRENELPRAMASLGGNVLAYGDRPDGTPWQVGIQDPQRSDDPNGFVGVLSLTDSFAVTSGGYQRYFEQDGKRYHHIIDPSTGYPADSGLTSVTVVADIEGGDPRGAMCDAYSTAFFIMGEEKALDRWRDSQQEGETNPFELVLVTEDGRVVVTEGLADCFTLDENSGYAYEAVS